MSERPQPGATPDLVEAQERARVDAHEVSWAMRDVQRAQAHVDRALARRLRLRGTDYAAMDHLMTSDRPVGPADLSARLGISTGSATELVDRLESQGHLARTRHSRDRRRIVLTPTDASIGEMLEQLSPLLAELDRLAGSFNSEEQAAITRYLRAVAQALRDYSDTSH